MEKKDAWNMLRESYGKIKNKQMKDDRKKGQ